MTPAPGARAAAVKVLMMTAGEDDMSFRRLVPSLLLDYYQLLEEGKECEILEFIRTDVETEVRRREEDVFTLLEILMEET